MKKKFCGIAAIAMCATLILSGCSLNGMSLDDVKSASLAKVDEMFELTDKSNYNKADVTLSAELSGSMLDLIATELEAQGDEYKTYADSWRGLSKVGAELTASGTQQVDDVAGTLSLKVSAFDDMLAKMHYTMVGDKLYISVDDYGSTTGVVTKPEDSEGSADSTSSTSMTSFNDLIDMNVLEDIHTFVRDFVTIYNDTINEDNTKYVTKDVTLTAGEATVEANKFATSLEQDAVKTAMTAIIEKVESNPTIRNRFKDEETGVDEFADFKENWTTIANNATAADISIYVIGEEVKGYEVILYKDDLDAMTISLKNCEADGVYWWEFISKVYDVDKEDYTGVSFVIDATAKDKRPDNVHIAITAPSTDENGKDTVETIKFPLYNVDLEALSKGLFRGTVKLNKETYGADWDDMAADFKEFGINDLCVEMEVYMETEDDAKVTIRFKDGDTDVITASMQLAFGVSDTPITAPTENVVEFDDIETYLYTLDIEKLSTDLISVLGMQDMLTMGYDTDTSSDDNAIFSDNGGTNDDDMDWYADLYGDSTPATSADDDWFADMYS